MISLENLKKMTMIALRRCFFVLIVTMMIPEVQSLLSIVESHHRPLDLAIYKKQISIFWNKYCRLPLCLYFI
jgi:hypothetical protein